MNHTSHTMQVPKLMGVLNLTPDSFSDGGRYAKAEDAIAQAKQFIEFGVAAIDLGGESTRPGSVRISPQEEQSRVLPTLEALAQLPEVAEGKVQLSIDTMNASTAAEALKVGATIFNDVSGGQADEESFRLVAQNPKLIYVLGHWPSFGLSSNPNAADHWQPQNLLTDLVGHLRERIKLAVEAGVRPDQIVIDPGLGFAKNSEQNWQILNNLASLTDLGHKIMIGASRKRFVVTALEENQGQPIENERRDQATATLGALLWAKTQTLGLASSLWGFRVHNVQASRDALAVASALRFAQQANHHQS